MIQVAFKDGSTLVECGSSVDDVAAAIQSACSKLSVEIEQVDAVHFPGSECCEPEYLRGLLKDVKQKLLDEEKQEDVQFAIDALRQYADPNNWSGISNRQRVCQRRWKGGGEGVDLAQAVLDRLQKHENYARLGS